MLKAVAEIPEPSKAAVVFFEASREVKQSPKAGRLRSRSRRAEDECFVAFFKEEFVEGEFVTYLEAPV